MATADVVGSPYAIVASNATGGSFTPSNYSISYVNGALTVTPAPLTITAQDVSKVYGQAPTLSGFDTAGLVNSETVGSVTLASTGQVATADVVGSPYAIVASDATGGSFTPGNYTIGYVNGALTVTPAPLTITAQDVSKVYGQTPALLGYDTTGLLNGDTVGSVTLMSLGQLATASAFGSPYVIEASDATAGTFTPSNYQMAYVNGELSVTPMAAPVNTPVVDPASVPPAVSAPMIVPDDTTLLVVLPPANVSQGLVTVATTEPDPLPQQVQTPALVPADEPVSTSIEPLVETPPAVNEPILPEVTAPVPLQPKQDRN